MVEKLNLISVEGEKEIACEITLRSQNNSNTICFESEGFLLHIVLKDVVDLEDFYNFLNGKVKKTELHCTLKIIKEYQGLRKITLKNNKIAVSLGGVRIEFGPSAKEKLIEVIKSIKNRI